MPFTGRYGDLRGQVRRLKEELGDTPSFHTHPTTKLFNAVHGVIIELVPADPDRKDFLVALLGAPIKSGYPLGGRAWLPS